MLRDSLFRLCAQPLRSCPSKARTTCKHKVKLALVLPQARPLLTKCMTSLTGFAIGDTLAQVPPPSSFLHTHGCLCSYTCCSSLSRMLWPRLLLVVMLPEADLHMTSILASFTQRTATCRAGSAAGGAYLDDS